MWSALMGSLQISCFLTGTFWVLPLTYFDIPKSARAYLFSQSVKIHYFCSGPISVDPICPQPSFLQCPAVRNALLRGSSQRLSAAQGLPNPHSFQGRVQRKKRNGGRLHPISLLALSLPRFVNSTFPGNFLWACGIPPLKPKILLESNPLKSRILVRRLAVSTRVASGQKSIPKPPMPSARLSGYSLLPCVSLPGEIPKSGVGRNC